MFYVIGAAIPFAIMKFAPGIHPVAFVLAVWAIMGGIMAIVVSGGDDTTTS